MGATTHLQSPGFSINRRPGRRLPPRHERPGYKPDEPSSASETTTSVIRALSSTVTQRQIDDARAAQEARERIGVNPESPWDRLQRLLIGPAVIQITQNPSDEHLTVSIQLGEIFGGDYRPRDGINLALRTPEGTLGLKVDWSMVWVHTPSSVAKDPRSVFFVRTSLPSTLAETYKNLKVEECVLLITFRGKRRELPVGVIDLVPKPF